MFFCEHDKVGGIQIGDGGGRGIFWVTAVGADGRHELVDQVSAEYFGIADGDKAEVTRIFEANTDVIGRFKGVPDVFYFACVEQPAVLVCAHLVSGRGDDGGVEDDERAWTL